MIVLDRNTSVPLYRQIHASIIEDIASGALAPGSRLPSIRAQANILNVSLNTVEQSYRQLAEEGWVVPKAGSGFVVRQMELPASTLTQRSEIYTHDLALLKAFEPTISVRDTAEFDFSYSTLEPAAFPRHQWSQTLRELPYAENWKTCLHYSAPHGLPNLRKQLSAFLARESGLAADPAQIIATSVSREAIVSISCLFDPKTDRIGIEDPGFWEAHNAFTLRGFKTVPLDVTHGERAFLQDVERARPKLIYVTPSNQFPTNRVMAPSTRQALLAWAEENDAYILEDDYCHEFRYGIDHLPSLQAEDSNGRVITIGTFSKSAMPALCLGYAVLPPVLMSFWLNQSRNWHSSASWYAQEAMARFMESGQWERHLRKLQTMCRNKYHTLTQAIETYLGERVNVMNYRAGLHLLIGTKDERSSEQLIELARQAGVKVYPTTQYWVRPVPNDWNYVLLGFMSTPQEDIEPGIKRLAQAWFGDGEQAAAE